MTTQQFWKGLLMALVAVIITAFSTTPVNYILMGITAVCALLTYFGKNLIPWLHSDSPVATLSIINLVSGLLVALGSGLLTGLGTYFVDGQILWPIVWRVVVSLTLTYFGSTFFAPPYNGTKTTKLFIK